MSSQHRNSKSIKALIPELPHSVKNEQGNLWVVVPWFVGLCGRREQTLARKGKICKAKIKPSNMALGEKSHKD